MQNLYDMDTMDNYDYLFKIVVIGDSGVGKSSICSRFANGVFDDRFVTTIGVDFEICTINLDADTAKLQIWDTAGQERFKSITSSYYRGAQGIIIVFDVTSWESFRNVKTWLEEVDERIGDGCIKLILGNKSDQQCKREISFDVAKNYADNLGIPYLETSAKNSTNVEQAFVNLAMEIKRQTLSEGERTNRSSNAHAAPTNAAFSFKSMQTKSMLNNSTLSSFSCCNLF